MKIIAQYIALFISILSYSCSAPNAERDLDTKELNSIANSYAQGFKISPTENGFVLNVYNPWQEAKGVTYSYLLAQPNAVFNKSAYSEIIHVPVSKVVCLSTTHIAYIDLLEQTESIIGVSGSNFISSPRVRYGIDKGTVSDVGFEQSINYELLVSLKPDVVFSYGVGAEMAGYLQKLKDLKIPVVFIGEYLEENPLGKAEWLKAFGLFFGQFDEADSLFKGIESEYNRVANQAKRIELKPKVFINIPWKDIWYFPGGDGYMAKLIQDAAGNYLLSDLEGSRSFPYSIESALEIGMNADVWINTGSANSFNQIFDNHPILKGLPMFKNGYIYNNNNRVNQYGGNDFWESGVVNPHIILKDLVEIFHPDSINHQLYYYKQLR